MTNHPFIIKALNVLAFVILKSTDPILKWGQKTCPQCFSKGLIPVKMESDEPAHHYCNGCNTLFQPRVKKFRA